MGDQVSKTNKAETLSLTMLREQKKNEMKMSPMQQQEKHDVFDVFHYTLHKLQKQKDF